MAIRNVLLGFVWIALFLHSHLASQAQEHPVRLLDFIKTGDQVLLRRVGDTGLLRVTILTERESRLLQDAKKLEFNDLAARYPELQKLGEAAIEKDQESYKSRGALDLGKKKVVAQVALDYRYRNTPVAVLHVGGDYVIFEHEPGKKTIYSASRLTTIDWFEGISIEAGLEDIK